MGRLTRPANARQAPPALVLLCLLAVLALTGCGGDAAGTAEARGQISRPGDVGLPLDDPASVAAFDVADEFLLEWFLLRDIDGALEQIHPNFREPYRSLLEDTRIERTCSLLQVEGSTPDASGTVTARYAIGGCLVNPPSVNTAVYIELTLIPGESGPWVSQVEFLR